MIDIPTLEAPAPAPGTRRELMAGRVLLAEDDGEMRRLLASALRSDRYDVLEAADGKELIDQLCDAIVDNHPVDCIVTDVRMPKLTGIEALRFIKNAGLGMPVIVITAFGDHATHIEAWMLGAAAVLDKPFDIEDLLEEIRRLRTDPEWGSS